MTHELPPDAPRVLVISNNPFSGTQNNGKTLASLFSVYPQEHLAQVYFSNHATTALPGTTFLGVDENELFRHPLSREIPLRLNRLCNARLQPGSPKFVGQSRQTSSRVRKSKWSQEIKQSHFARVVREVLWLNRDPSIGTFGSKLKEFNPEIVFLMAGDSVFAHRLAREISKAYGARLLTYVTDDYVLPGRWVSPLGRARRWAVHRSLLQTLARTDLFFTISPKMQSVYRDFLGSNSTLLMNVSEVKPKDEEPQHPRDEAQPRRMVYAGALHSRRTEVLIALAEALADYNQARPPVRQVHLHIYTGSQIGRRALARLDQTGCSSVAPLLDPVKYTKTISSADFVLHVESFHKKAARVTALSLSTKIPELLETGKPIVAIGPSSLASIDFLSDKAFCVTDLNSLGTRLVEVLDRDNERTTLFRSTQQLEEPSSTVSYSALAWKALLEDIVAQGTAGGGE